MFTRLLLFLGVSACGAAQVVAQLPSQATLNDTPAATAPVASETPPPSVSPPARSALPATQLPGNTGLPTAPAPVGSVPAAAPMPTPMPTPIPTGVATPAAIPNTTDLSPAAISPNPVQLTQAAAGSGPTRPVSIPSGQGQVLQEYDISDYTSRVKSTVKPEQALVDWILRETGTDVWFSEPFGFLNASKSTLRVYHTKEMQQVVKGIVDRFISSRPEAYVLGLRMVTVGSPNWRVTALPLMQPVTVQSPGVEAWLVSKEHAALILANLQRRGDFADKSSQDVVVENGQSQTVSRTWPREYMRTLQPGANGAAGYSLVRGQIDEGYSLQLSPLFSVNERSVDAVIKCNVDQVEKLVPITIDVPGTQQRVQIQVPQLVSWRLHERFRWPTDQVLLLSCGVVATPGPAQDSGPLGINNLLNPQGRADALVFIECKGRSSQSVLESQPRTALGGEVNSRGRY